MLAIYCPGLSPSSSAPVHTMTSGLEKKSSHDQKSYEPKLQTPAAILRHQFSSPFQWKVLQDYWMQLYSTCKKRVGVCVQTFDLLAAINWITSRFTLYYVLAKFSSSIKLNARKLLYIFVLLSTSGRPRSCSGLLYIKQEHKLCRHIFHEFIAWSNNVFIPKLKWDPM